MIYLRYVLLGVLLGLVVGFFALYDFDKMLEAFEITATAVKEIL